MLSHFRFLPFCTVKSRLSLLPTQSLWTSLPSHTWSTGSCFSPAHFCSVGYQRDFSKNKKKKTSSADSFAPAAAHPVPRCSSTLLQPLGLGGEEERLSTGVIPNERGGDRSCGEAGCSRLHISCLLLYLLFIYYFRSLESKMHPKAILHFFFHLSKYV